MKTLSLVNPTTGKPINIANPFGALGSPLAQLPPFSGNIRARYEFKVNEYNAFWQVGATHQAHSYAYYEASLGVSKDVWGLQLYGENLSNTQANLYADYSQFVKAVTINRPRTLGLRFSYKFGTQ